MNVSKALNTSEINLAVIVVEACLSIEIVALELITALVIVVSFGYVRKHFQTLYSYSKAWLTLISATIQYQIQYQAIF